MIFFHPSIQKSGTFNGQKKHQEHYKKHQDFFKKLQIVLFKTSNSFFQDIKEFYLQCRGVHCKTAAKNT
jgi:hypothetical protein